MIIYPAIELQQGRVVRMRRGNPNAQTVVSDDPVSVAQQWEREGAEWLHIVNLDCAIGVTKVIQIGAAALGEEFLSKNLRVLKKIRQAVGVPIQYAGGLRSLEDINLAFELGASRVLLDPSAVEKPSLVCKALDKWGADRIVVCLDAQDGLAATHHWQPDSGADLVEMGHYIYAMGVRRVLYSHASSSLEQDVIDSARLGDSTGLHVIVSGSNASLEDIALLKEHEYYNIDGVVACQSLYTNVLDLGQAIELGKRALVRHSAGIIPYRKIGTELQILIIYNYALEQWQLPRGYIEQGENVEDCAQREFYEQTGLQLAQFHPSPAIPLDFVRQFREYKIQRSIVYFLGQVQDGEVQLSNENHCEALWASPAEAIALIGEAGHEQLPALNSALHSLGL